MALREPSAWRVGHDANLRVTHVTLVYLCGRVGDDFRRLHARVHPLREHKRVATLPGPTHPVPGSDLAHVLVSMRGAETVYGVETLSAESAGFNVFCWVQFVDRA